MTFGGSIPGGPSMLVRVLARAHVPPECIPEAGGGEYGATEEACGGRRWGPNGMPRDWVGPLGIRGA